jgi:GNAT superfamily N-acetyltransferase
MGESLPPVDQRQVSNSRAGLELRRASAEDVHRLKAVFAAAFYEDPIIGWMMPDERSRERRLRRFFAIELRQVALVRGAVWTSTDLSGAAMSNPPGAWGHPWRVFFPEGQNFGIRLPRAARLLAAMHRRHPRHPHYYFRDVGVLPEMQGQGIGSALMRPTLERCDRERLPAYLEATSERSASLYARLGFQPKGELRVAGSPPLWPMLRSPELPTEASP